MAGKGIQWDDNTGDELYVSFTGNAGTSSLTITSDPNGTPVERTHIISLAADGKKLAELTVTQKPRGRAYSIAYGKGYK